MMDTLGGGAWLWEVDFGAVFHPAVSWAPLPEQCLPWAPAEPAGNGRKPLKAGAKELLSLGYFTEVFVTAVWRGTYSSSPPATLVAREWWRRIQGFQSLGLSCQWVGSISDGRGCGLASAPGRPGWGYDEEWMWEDVRDELISCGPCQATVAVRGAFPKREIWKSGILVSWKANLSVLTFSSFLAMQEWKPVVSGQRSATEPPPPPPPSGHLFFEGIDKAPNTCVLNIKKKDLR